MYFASQVTLAGVDVFPIQDTNGVSPGMALGEMPKRPALLLRLTDTEGCQGWGEIWANFPPRANLHKAHLIEDVMASRITGLSYTDPVEINQQLRTRLSTYFLHIGQCRVFEHLLAGLDIALWDLALRRAGRSFVEHMELPHKEAQTYASSINPPDLQKLLTRHAESGQDFFKLKLGLNNARDLAFVERASKLKADHARLMVDSNQSWSLAEAENILGALEDFDLVFSEEPLRADAPIAQWERLAQALSIPLAGGENLYGIDEFLTMANAGVQFLQPDVAKWGGVTGALALAEMLPDGVSLWPHFMGTAVGQMAALSVSAAIGAGSVCEMDVNVNPLRTELCGDVLQIKDGSVALPKEPGLVCPPNPDFLWEKGHPFPQTC